MQRLAARMDHQASGKPSAVPSRASRRREEPRRKLLQRWSGIASLSFDKGNVALEAPSFQNYITGNLRVIAENAEATIKMPWEIARDALEELKREE